jgi:hypothetical protein
MIGDSWFEHRITLTTPAPGSSADFDLGMITLRSPSRIQSK